MSQICRVFSLISGIFWLLFFGKTSQVSASFVVALKTFSCSPVVTTPKSSLLIGSSFMFDLDHEPTTFLHSVSGSGRLLPSSSKWNSIELDFKLNLFPMSKLNNDSLPSQYSKSYDYELVITDKAHLKRFVFISILAILVVIAVVLLFHFLPHKHRHDGASKNLTLALGQALTFFDAQKSGNYPNNSPVKFRGSSGLYDGNSSSPPVDLVGGFYDSGNNIKFSFTTAYTVTLLSWTVIEYHDKYADIGELNHVKDIIKWGSDFLLKVFSRPNSNTSAPAKLYSQVGGTYDVRCWQRPEDMDYARNVSVCDETASDLAGEIIAAMSAASIVFKEDKDYSGKLKITAEQLFNDAAKNDTNHRQGTYTEVDTCGGQARMFYNSSGYKDELVWGWTWLFFATGNSSYLGYVADSFSSAEAEEMASEKGVLYWNNKLMASAILLARIRYFHDLGYPFESVLASASKMADLRICSYLSTRTFYRTPGGLILLIPDSEKPLQYAATASFVTKLYSDYLELMVKSGLNCSTDGFSLEMLRTFSMSQIKYILGDNPLKMSYIVGFGKKYPTQVHHRAASIPWDGQHYSCPGDSWLYSKAPNPNILSGAMVAGPDQFDNFIDKRDKPEFTEPSIASNAGLVAALIALHDPPREPTEQRRVNLGIDQDGIFEKHSFFPEDP